MNKVTIVTVTYNCNTILEETILSCISQDYVNKEYIIIDGASKDGTVDVIKKYADKINFWISETDKGIYDAMNKGIEHATGDWIIFINAGDYLADSYVLSRIFGYDIKSDIGVIWGQNNTITEKGIVRCLCEKPFWAKSGRYKTMGFNHQSVLVRLSILKENNMKFDLSYKLTADYNMIYSLYNNMGVVFLYMPFPISTVEGVDGASATHRRLQRAEEARVCGCDKTFGFFLYTNYKSLRATLKNVLKNINIIK